MQYLNIFTLLIFSIPTLLTAQTDDRVAVEYTIHQLFDGMRAADSAQVAATFHPDLRLQTVSYDAKGEAVLQTGEVERFLKSVATFSEGMLDEQLYGLTVELDPPLATAWTPYTLFVNGEPIHCGTNAFQLIKVEEQWLIHQITDTRRKTDCQTNKSAQADSLHRMVDAWHRAAATADADLFYGSMTADAIYLGTDATERWLRDELREWAAFAFERESAWDFTPAKRNLYFTDNQSYAWWEEDLVTWMGPCRGSGVAQLIEGKWKIKHYHLSVTLPNEKVEGFLELVSPEKD